MYNQNVRAGSEISNSYSKHDNLSHPQVPRIPAPDSASHMQGGIPPTISWDWLTNHSSCVLGNSSEAKLLCTLWPESPHSGLHPHAFISFILVPISKAPSHFKRPENMFN